MPRTGLTLNRTASAGPDSGRAVRVGELMLGPRERAQLQRVIDSNRLSYGPVTREFEATFARLHEVPFACFCNSGTSALQVALAALKEQRGWTDGDEVLVPAVTFVASVNVIWQNRLTPVLVDVDPATCNIDASRIAAAITPRTRCIMPVHLLGLPCDMAPILDLARRHNLAIVEDSCETMFARYQGRPVGSFGDVACFSTYVAHFLVTGVGGLAVTRDRELARLIRSLMNHGRDNIYISIDDDAETGAPAFREIVDRRFRFERIGYSYRCTELEAAIGLGQIAQWREILDARQANAAFLTRALADLDAHLQLPSVPPGREHAFMVFPIVVRDDSMRPLVYHLEERGIETRDMLPLIHQPVYRAWLGADVGRRYPVAHHLYDRAFYIGCHQHLTPEDLRYVVESIHAFYR